MKNLYMIGIGGKTNQSNIEVHDIQFLIGDSIEATYDCLRDKWYGIENSLHMDSYLSVKGVVGYEICIKEAENKSEEALYLVTFGGTQTDVFQELHCYELVVATSEKEARKKAMGQVEHSLENLHVDNIVKINRDTTSSKYDLHFKKSDDVFSVKPEWQGFTKLSGRHYED